MTDATPISFRELAQAAVLAPSPDNNQPWRFTVEGNRLVIRPDMERNLPSDVGGMFMMMALGAAAENAAIAARNLGFDTEVVCRPNSAGGDLPLVEIALRPGASADPLFPYLADRRTCRKWYSTQPLAHDDDLAIESSIESFPEVQLHWVTGKSPIRQLARLVATTDLVRLQHRPFHEELYKQLRFTPDEAQRTRDGLDLRTLELPPGAGALLGALRNWRRMALVHRLHLGWMLAVPSAAAVRKSGAIGIVTVSSPTVEHYLEGGRAFQRIWLTAQARAVALQPLGSLPIFLAHLEQLGGRELKAEHRRRLARVPQMFHEIAPAARGRVLLMLFRAGYGAAPSCRSLRRPLEDVFRA
jgi:hypothetical protein